METSSSSSLSSSLEEASTPGQIQTGLGPRVYLFIPQTAALPGSDAGSDVIKSASSFVTKTVRSRAPCGARCIGHAVST